MPKVKVLIFLGALMHNGEFITCIEKLKYF
jgi:hypothetical protein